MRLRFTAREVHALARRYSFSSEVPLVEIGRRARARGHLTAQELRLRVEVLKVSMRELDRALWQYSKERQ